MRIKIQNNLNQEIGAKKTVIKFFPQKDESVILINLLKNLRCSILRVEDYLLVDINFYQLETLNDIWSTYFPNSVDVQDQLISLIERNKIVWEGANFSFDLTNQSIIYSIINLTPDSFYDGNENLTTYKVLKRIEKDIINGAKIFELGGKSVRPDFSDITAKEEWKRVGPFLKEIKEHFPDLILSLDSNNSVVMEEGLKEGIDIVNDIDGFSSEKKLELIDKYKPSIVSMHNGRKFRTSNMTLAEEITEYFEKTLHKVREKLPKNYIAIDPGVGFSYNADPMFDILRIKSVNLLNGFNLPIMVAVSRKSFLGKLFGLKAEDRLLTSILLQAFMVQSGGRILRVHDVKETREMLDVLDKYNTIYEFNGN